MFRVIFGLFLTCCMHSIYTAEYPVDMCYMVADLKYSAEKGVKICEIQQACLSLFNGNTFRTEEESIHTKLLRVLSLYNKNGWVVSNSLADKNLVVTLEGAPSWQGSKDLIKLLLSPQFLAQAKQPVSDVFDISSYQGILYVNWSHLCVLPDFEKRFPGMIVMDKSSFSFWIDKYRMSKLFTEDEQLIKVKPKWGNYKKEYTQELARQIADDLQCDTFVIKPRGEFLGKGVIIVSQEELDEVLRYIITKEGTYTQNKDTAYSVWKKDPFDSFIVEEFVASDPIMIPHLDNKIYQPTMRVAFLLVYNNHCHTIHFLGEYWKTPQLSIDEEGDFMHKNKDICKSPYYCPVDAQIKQQVHNELGIALPILHSKMMQFSSNEEELGCPKLKGQLQQRLKARLDSI